MRSGFRGLSWGLAIALALAAIAAGCAHVPPHRRLPALPVDDPAFAATLEAHTAAPVTEGNAVRVLLNGDEIFPEKLAAIRGAQTSVTYAEYAYAEGAAALATAEALAARCRAGVQVTILLDGIGSAGMPESYDRLLRDAGCRLAYYRPLRHLLTHRLNHRNHRRILVVDGRVGFTGGSGMSGKWAGDGRTEGQWRDTDVRIEGPAVRFLQGAFVESWREATGTLLGGPAYFPDPLPAPGTVRVQLIASTPAADDFDIYTMFLLAIEGARRTVHITNPYFVPDDVMMEALLRALRRGVRVVVLLPGRIDWNVVRLVSRRAMGPLLAAGGEFYEYTTALLHAKSMVVDGVWATVGSTNLDGRSLGLNAELNAVIYGAGVAGQLDGIFMADLAEARHVSYEQWRERPRWHRFLELLAWPLRHQL